MNKYLTILLIFIFASWVPVFSQQAPTAELWKWKFDLKDVYPAPNLGRAIKIRMDILALDTDIKKHDIRLYATALNLHNIGVIRDLGIVQQGKDVVIEIVPKDYILNCRGVIIEGDCPTLGKNVKIHKKLPLF